MPEPFIENVTEYNGKLAVSWIAPAFDTRAILVAVSAASNFQDRRVFVMPVCGQAILTVGNGDWFVCVGAAHGTPERGVVSWSGSHGPVAIRASTDSLPPTPSYSIPVLHSKPVDGGYRIHTGKPDPHVVFFEMGRVGDVGTQFPIAKTNWKWVAEKGGGAGGWVDCWGLNYPETYAIRMSSFDAPAFPTDRVVILGAGKVFPRVVCARTPFHRDFSEKQNARGDALLLQQRKVDPNMKFTSHADYLRYQAALTRSGDDKARTVGPAHFSVVEEAERGLL